MIGAEYLLFNISKDDQNNKKVERIKLVIGFMFIRGKALGQADTDLLISVKMDEPTAKMEVDLHWCLGIFAMFVAILVLEFFSDMSRGKNRMKS